MKIQVEVSWVVMPCSVVVGYQHFGGLCCLHLQGKVNGARKVVQMEVASLYENTTWRHNPGDLDFNSHLRHDAELVHISETYEYLPEIHFNTVTTSPFRSSK